MSLYPKWLLALAGANLLSVLLSVFYLFGGVQPLGTSENGLIRFLLFLTTQLLWLAPIVCFFGALRAHDYRHPQLAASIALFGLLILALSVWLLI
ncbi:MAG: hypothetical protein IKH52_04140 [Bacteroidaceae bacterium]|nr:hypothetical protein [Bacteroidaceae bacterium]